MEAEYIAVTPLLIKTHVMEAEYIAVTPLLIKNIHTTE